VSEGLGYQSIQMKQRRVERTPGSTRPWRSKLRRSISELITSKDANEGGSTLVLLYVIACLVAMNLILRLPGAAMTLDQINQMLLCGP
jgi:hypothetical protein